MSALGRGQQRLRGDHPKPTLTSTAGVERPLGSEKRPARPGRPIGPGPGWPLRVPGQMPRMDIHGNSGVQRGQGSRDPLHFLNDPLGGVTQSFRAGLEGFLRYPARWQGFPQGGNNGPLGCARVSARLRRLGSIAGRHRRPPAEPLDDLRCDTRPRNGRQRGTPETQLALGQPESLLHGHMDAALSKWHPAWERESQPA